MKLNLFKKKNSRDLKAKSQKLDKNQLEKVTGGADATKAVSSGNVDTAINLRL